MPRTATAGRLRTGRNIRITGAWLNCCSSTVATNRITASYRRATVAAGVNVVAILAVAAASLALKPEARSGDSQDRIVRTTPVPSYNKLAAGTWRQRPVQGKPFWFTLGGGDDSAAHFATLKQRPIADSGLAMYGVAEWGYSFHYLKNGQPDKPATNITAAIRNRRARA